VALILHIDTALENAVISIAEDGHIMGFYTNNNQKEHASFLQPAIQQLLKDYNIAFNQLKAVAVTAGPGSYTGLRVGMAGAKGICYALHIPLITLSTLEVMAFSIIQNTDEPGLYFYCPMIDAGRMEVFTALFDNELNAVIASCALILQPKSFDDYLQGKKIIFTGSGSKKFIDQSTLANLIYVNGPNPASALALLAIKKFNKNDFAHLPSAEPTYIKHFYTIAASH
jgi:tRNA threonylcarbamoyladenosine biosynthesis protein TsaB